MKFEYFAGEQRTPEWYKLRLGKPTASRLEDWMATSKAAKTLGKPLKPRLDYEKELVFEKQFGVAFDFYVSQAMQEGIALEDFAIEQYTQITGNEVVPVGCWYNDHFVASPDGGVGDEGLVEAKVLRDTVFTDVLVNGIPPKHWKQCQGELFASGRRWVDYVAINLTTRKIKIIRVLPDKEFHEFLELSIMERITTPEFDKKDVYDFSEEPPLMIASSDGDFSEF